MKAPTTDRFVVAIRRDKRSIYWTANGFTTELRNAREYSEGEALLRMKQMERNGEKAFIDSRAACEESDGFSNNAHLLFDPASN